MATVIKHHRLYVTILWIFVVTAVLSILGIVYLFPYMYWHWDEYMPMAIIQLRATLLLDYQLTPMAAGILACTPLLLLAIISMYVVYILDKKLNPDLQEKIAISDAEYRAYVRDNPDVILDREAFYKEHGFAEGWEWEQGEEEVVQEEGFDRRVIVGMIVFVAIILIAELILTQVIG